MLCSISVQCFNFSTDKPTLIFDQGLDKRDIKNPAKKNPAGVRGEEKHLHPFSLHTNDKIICDAAHTRATDGLIFFSCRLP